MKVLLVIFAICISYTLGEGTTTGIATVSGYPKKYRPYMNGKILINAAKYEKPSNPPVVRSYTAFQLVGSHPHVVKADVPDSPYFPVDQVYDQKARVKKVLELDSLWSLLRNKRSAVLNVSPVEKDDKKIEAKAAEVEKVKETTPIPTAAAEETTVKSSSPKEVQEESKSTIISTTTVKSVTGKEIERAGSTAKQDNPVRKGNSPIPKQDNPVRKGNSPIPKQDNLVRKGNSSKPKSKAAAKKNSGRASRNSKSKPKGKKAKVGRAKPRGKKTKSAKKPKRNQTARKKDNKRKGKTQRSKKQKAKPKNGPAGKIPKGKPVQPTNMEKNPK